MSKEGVNIKAVDISRMASPSEVIFEALRTAITDGSLSENQVLRQDHIAKMFNVSRIPVREALARLEEQGLVTTQRYRGAVVASLSFEEIQEIFEFRSLLEPEVLGFSLQNIRPQSLAQAELYCEQFAQTNDPAQWGELNRMFHYSLYQDCNRPYYLQVVNASLNRIERYQRLQITLTNGMDMAYRSHREIFETCAKGDIARAKELTRAHILGACKALIDILQSTRHNEN